MNHIRRRLLAAFLLVALLLMIISAVLTARLLPFLVALVALAPVLVLAYFLSRSITDPIERLQAMAVRMAEGDLSYRVGILRKDELGRLAASLNDVAGTLEHRLGVLAAAQEQTEGILAAMQDGVLVLDRVGQVVRANTAAAALLSTSVEEMQHRPLVHSARALAAAPAVSQALLLGSAESGDVVGPGGRQLAVQTVPLSLVDSSVGTLLVLLRDETARRTTDRVRRDFVANVSHELKTPLARLSLLASTLDHAIDEDPDQARAFATILSREIAALTALVNDLLALSQIEEHEQQETAFSDTVDLAEVCREVGATMDAVAANQDRYIQVEASLPAFVHGDRTLLITLVRNLVDNALRYNRPEGHVWVSVRLPGQRTDSDTASGSTRGPALLGAGLDPAPGEILLTVTDDGLGIPREQQDRIFERFYRVDVARTSGGTGLGLSIVRHIAERHGATVEVASAVGVGSRFGVRFPSATATEQKTQRGSPAARGPEQPRATPARYPRPTPPPAGGSAQSPQEFSVQ